MDVESKQTISDSIDRAQAGLNQSIATAALKLGALIADLDGWTLELDPPIVIRTIRLTKPNKSA